MSEKPDDRTSLSHILEAIDRIYRFSTGMDKEEFKRNEMAHFAVIKNFEIIGEATYHLSKELKKRHPTLEWKKIEAFRHVLVHDYYRVNLEIVWKTKKEKLENLRAEIRRILSENP